MDFIRRPDYVKAGIMPGGTTAAEIANMPAGQINNFQFYALEVLNWLLNIAIIGLLYLIASRVLTNLPSLLNIITI